MVASTRITGYGSPDAVDNPPQNSVSMVRISLALLLSLGPLVLLASADDLSFHTGSRFRAKLNEPALANWQNVELRDVLEQISQDRHVALLLDRRIDPNVKHPVEFANQPLTDGLTRLATHFGGGVSLPNNVVYLGPEQAAHKLRTLIALRTEELSAKDSGVSKDRRHAWLKPHTVRWDDLDAPREMLDRLQADLKFRILNPSLVEHDLWAAATLPDVTGVEALSLILIQFDLTFAWQNGAEVVELLPVPDVVRIERSHKVRGKSVDQALREWQAEWPNVEFRASGREILALATVEEHEQIDAGAAGRDKPAVKPAPLPLAKRQFTLESKGVSALDLMEELEKSGIEFDYDPQELAAAGVDLKRLVQLNVRNLSASDFFHAVFDSLGVKFTITGLTVTLKPK
jgi:hypothetical protein